MDLDALSMTQPYGQLVVEDYKHYETRSWGTKHRGLVAIQATKTFPRWAKKLLEQFPFNDALNRPPEDLALGAIIGLVHIVDCIPTEQARLSEKVSAWEYEFGDWGDGRFVWKLVDPILLQYPVPCVGHLSIWKVPEDVAAAVYEQHWLREVENNVVALTNFHTLWEAMG